jgi:hypothetical protein
MSLIAACGMVALRNSAAISAVAIRRVTAAMSRWMASRSFTRPSLVARTGLATGTNQGISVRRRHCTSLPMAM